MMNDLYAECLVKKKSQTAAAKILLAVGLVLSALSVVVFGVYGCIIFLLMCGLAFYISSTMNVEYEYLFAEKQLSVDRIFNKSRRKKAADYNMEDIQTIAPITSEKVKDYERQIKKVTDFSSGRTQARRYAIIYQKQGVCEKVLFEPDDNLLHCIKMAAPRKVSDT